MSARLRPVVLAAVILLVAYAIVGGLVALGGGEDHRAPAVTTPSVTIPTESKVDSEDADRKPDETITAPVGAVQEAAKGVHDDLRDETPTGVSDRQLDAAQEQQEKLAQADNLPVVTPAAAPEQAGCRSNFVGNYSSRGGVRPRLWVLHFTVSLNRPGWADVNAIVSLFNTWAFQASSNYIYDFEGHCAYIVRESDKAWTQARFNPLSISVEVIANGREGRFVTGVALKKLGKIISDSMARWEIPLQKGAVKGCVVIKPGLITHQMLGACGGGHLDISPYSMDQILTAAKIARRLSNPPPSTPARYLTRGEQRSVSCLVVERKIAKRHGGWGEIAPSHLKRARGCKLELRRSLAGIERAAKASGWDRNRRRERHSYIRSLV